MASGTNRLGALSVYINQFIKSPHTNCHVVNLEPLGRLRVWGIGAVARFVYCTIKLKATEQLSKWTYELIFFVQSEDV